MGNPILRENFVQRVFVLWRWYHLIDSGMTFAGLIGFHARHKLGMMVTAMTTRDVEEQAPSYLSELMIALEIRVTRQNHINILQHLSG